MRGRRQDVRIANGTRFNTLPVTQNGPKTRVLGNDRSLKAMVSMSSIPAGGPRLIRARPPGITST